MLKALSQSYSKYGSVPNAIDIAKFLAIIIMVIDHLGYYFFFENLWFRAIGRIGFPIWFFFTGYSRPSKFSNELVILACVLAAVKTGVFLPFFPLNALVTIILCRFYADFLRKNNKFEKWKLPNLILIFITLLIWLLPTNYMFEYGTLAFMFTICGVLHRERPGHIHTKIAFGFALISFIFIEQMFFNFSSLQFIAMAAGTLVTVYLLSNFKIKPFPYLEKLGIFAQGGMFLARNSLYFYAIHIVLFAILSKIIFPEKYLLFRWL